MAIYTFKKGRWQGRITNKKLLPKPLYKTFDTIEEAKRFFEPIEASLKKGVVPASVKRLMADHLPRGDVDTLSQAIVAYKKVARKAHDIDTLATLDRALGKTRIREVTRKWCLDHVHDLKVVERLTPGTIRKRMGALKRLFTWLVNEMPDVAGTVNPLSDLENIAAITDDERALIEKAGDEVQENVERDVRLEPDDEKKIRAVLGGATNPKKERAPIFEDREELDMLFTLALESAMRLREMYTLTADQVVLKKETVYLDKTKNGDNRQVPLSSVAIAALNVYAQSKKLNFLGSRRTTRKVGGDLVFPILFDGDWRRDALKKTTSKVSRRFGWLFTYAGVKDFTFHDTRHEAVCRIYERTTLSDVQISRITGHKDLRMLRRYASLRGSDLAVKLW